MDERGAVNQLDDGGQADGAGAAIAAVTRREQEQSRAQALASAAEEIAGDFGNRLDGRTVLSGNFLFDEGKVVPDKVKKFSDGFDGEGRDDDPLGLQTAARRGAKPEEAAEIIRSGCGDLSRGGFSHRSE